MNSKNAIEVFEEFEHDIRCDAPAIRLRQILEILDDPAYERELNRTLKTINDPGRLQDVQRRLRRFFRDLEEKREKKKHTRDIIVQTGVAGGVGLVGASVVAAATALFPPIALIPVFGGAWMAFIGYRGASKLDAERHLYDQLAARFGEILKEIE